MNIETKQSIQTRKRNLAALGWGEVYKEKKPPTKSKRKTKHDNTSRKKVCLEIGEKPLDEHVFDVNPNIEQTQILNLLRASIEPSQSVITSPSKEELESSIRSFVDEHGTVRQGTPEWRELLGTTLGGSNAATLFNMNPYPGQRKKDLIAKMSSDDRPVLQSVPCMWGKLFESVIRTYVEVIFDNQIYGHDICILEGHFRYSPDGLGVVIDKKNGMKIVLFEFKCPFTRKPTNTVPVHYKPQLWAGLAATEELTDYGLFIDAVFRKCGEKQLGDTPDYDRKYHSSDGFSYGKPIAWGKLTVYSKEKAGPERSVDFGDADKKTFDSMLVEVDNGVFTTSLVCLTFAGNREDIINPQCFQGMRLIGNIPFKIFSVQCLKVDRIPGFKKRILKLVNDIFVEVEKRRSTSHAEIV